MNTLWLLDFGGGAIGHLDTEDQARSGDPDADQALASAPRPLDDRTGKLWFAEYGANAIGIYDTKADNGTSKSTRCRPRATQPYDAVADKNGNVWAGSMWSDRITRLDPATGTHRDVPAAERDEHPARMGRQHDRSGDVLGRQQARRHDRSVTDAELRKVAPQVPVGVGVLADRRVRPRRQDGRRIAVGQDAPVDDDQAVEPFDRAVQVVSRHQDRHPTLDEIAHDVHERVLGGHVNAGRRLVEQQQFRLLRQRPRDEHPLLLTARELGDVTVLQRAQIECREGGIDGPNVCRLQAREGSQPRIAAHRDDVAHVERERKVDFLGLRDVADRARREGARLPPEDAHAAGIRLDQARDRLEQGGFAGAVGADDPERRPRADLERDAVEREDAVVAHDDPVQLDRQAHASGVSS